MDALKMAVSPTLPLEIDGKRYQIAFPLRAIIAAEEKIGRPLREPRDWFCAAAKDLPALFEAGLSRHHPDITQGELETIYEAINPETYTTFTEALGTLNFPEWTNRYKENMAKLQAEAAAGRKKEASAVVH